MATSGQGLWTPLGSSTGNDSVRDYRHAARILGSNDYSRAPKNKFNFYVRFIINPGARAENVTTAPDFGSEVGYIVKSVELPKFEIDISEENQYNKKVLVQKQIKYNPVTIKFHDDNIGELRRFWDSYYTYYFMDGRYVQTDYDYTKDDKYKARVASRWGYDTKSTSPYLSAIEIHSMYHGQAQMITLQNPIISNFSHDTHEYSDNTGTLEASMSIRYTGVIYGDWMDASQGLPGFGQDAPEAYDTEYSGLTTGDGFQVDPATGEIYDPAFGIPGSSGYNVNPNQLYPSQLAAYNYNPSRPNYLTSGQLKAVARSVNRNPTNSPYLFPSAGSVPVEYTDYGAVPVQGSFAYSDGLPVLSPLEVAAVYAVGSWQQSMYQKGYSSNQIGSADKYIKSVNPTNNTNLQQLAETYIKNPNNQTLAQYGKPVFGQPASTPTKINFNDPTASTQPVYNSQDWRSDLNTSGYTKSEINSAERYLSTVKVAPGTDLTKIASEYIKYSKGKGTIGTTVKIPETTTQTSDLKGPTFNPVAPGYKGSGVNPELIAQYKPI